MNEELVLKYVLETCIVELNITLISFYEVQQCEDEHLHEACEQKEEECYKVAVVMYSDASIQPWTVVVVALHTPIADAAMSRSGRSYNLAIWT